MGASAPKVWAVVKANAYGHGIERVFPALSAADGFALLDVREAILLRNLGWEAPILLLEGVFCPEDLAVCARYDLWHTVHNAQQLAWLMQYQGAYRHHIYLKFNGGMNRLGLSAQALRQAQAQLRVHPNVADITLMMHFSDAEATPAKGDTTQRQLQRFDQATQGWLHARSLSNSAAILNYGAALRSDWVRAGIMLYGSSPNYPGCDVNQWQLQAAMSLNACIIGVQQLQPGDCVGYGSTFVADTAMRIGVVSCGYADGYPRMAPTGTPVLVDGVRTRVIGRVSMDMLTVDLSAIPRAGLGSAVTLWGHAATGDALLSIDEVAHCCGTIAYELMCALAARVPVHVV